MSLLLGAVADDFTGATDLANTLTKAGMASVQLIGVPSGEVEIGGAEAVVIALKSRTAPVGDAVAMSLAGLDWLRERGAQQYFFKYCSTFDSTDDGNIGPVMDAFIESLAAPIAIACPAFPANGRTVYRGHLFVGNQLLSDSPMKDHPLTPMREANLVTLLARQSRHPVGLVSYDIVRHGPEAIAGALRELAREGRRAAIVDAVSDEDLTQIGAAVAGTVLVTGGSGVAMGLPENFRKQGLLGPATEAPMRARKGLRAVLAGSCSEATRAQIAAVAEHWPCRRLEPRALAGGRNGVEATLEWARENGSDGPILIYSSNTPEAVGAVQADLGREAAGELVENAFREIAKGLIAGGTTQLIVAGGETSGAVTEALGIEALAIGPEIDPGVPWTFSTGTKPLALALKSGNFGGEDFFSKAFAMLP